MILVKFSQIRKSYPLLIWMEWHRYFKTLTFWGERLGTNKWILKNGMVMVWVKVVVRDCYHGIRWRWFSSLMWQMSMSNLADPQNMAPDRPSKSISNQFIKDSRRSGHRFTHYGHNLRFVSSGMQPRPDTYWRHMPYVWTVSSHTLCSIHMVSNNYL